MSHPFVSSSSEEISSSSSPVSGSVAVQSSGGVRGQRRAKGRRPYRWNVSVSEEDAVVILGKADKAGVTVQRLLVSLAVDSSVRSSVERKGTVSVLVGLSRQLAGVGTNLNQLARHANALGELGDAGRLDEALGLVEVLRAELESVLAEVK